MPTSRICLALLTTIGTGCLGSIDKPSTSAGPPVETGTPAIPSETDASPARADLGPDAASTSAAGGMKWHPGHYTWLDENASQAERDAVIDSLTNEPNVQGFQVFLNWGQLEGATAGDYTAGFAIVDAYLAHLASLKTKKHLILGLSAMWYGSTPPTSCSQLAGSELPAYLVTTEGCGIALPGAAGSTTASARFWEQGTMDRLIALSEAYAKRYDGNPLFEMFQAGGGETAAAIAGFDAGSDITQLERWLDASQVAWKTTQIRLAANYLGSDAQMQQLIADYGASGHVAIGGPDPELPLPTITSTIETNDSVATIVALIEKTITRSIQANELFRGARNNAPDLRGQVPWVAEVQAMGLGSRYTQLPIDIFEYQYDVMNASYYIWMNNTWAGSAPQRWSTGILPFIQSIGGKTHSDCPKSYTQGCNTN